MIEDMLKNITTIYVAYGVTDFRLHTASLCKLVENRFKINPYKREAFIFCNKRRNSIRVLCYDKNGFILAQKTLLDVSKYKFKWPKDEKELGQITHEQLSWLLSGLQICPKSYFKDIDIAEDKIAI